VSQWEESKFLRLLVEGEPEERDEVSRKKWEDLGVMVEEKKVEVGEVRDWVGDDLDEEDAGRMGKGGLV
jgi:hypothetical protein